jgi:hypothetical protein
MHRQILSFSLLFLAVLLKNKMDLTKMAIGTEADRKDYPAVLSLAVQPDGIERLVSAQAIFRSNF